MNSRGAVIFDLDGTITEPLLDFDAIRREIGLPPGPILESLEGRTAPDRARAFAVLERHERHAAENATLQSGARETIAAVRASGRPVAILTRNARHWTELILNQHGISVDAIRSREDGAIKPSAEPVVALCAALRCEPRASWVVGDYLFDIQSGRGAGCRTVLLIGRNPAPDYAALADHVIIELPQLLDLIVSDAD